MDTNVNSQMLSDCLDVGDAESHSFFLDATYDEIHQSVPVDEDFLESRDVQLTTSLAPASPPNLGTPQTDHKKIIRLLTPCSSP